MKALVIGFNDYHSLAKEEIDLIRRDNDNAEILLDYDFNEDKVNTYAETIQELGYTLLTLEFDDSISNKNISYAMTEVGHLSEVTPYIWPRYFTHNYMNNTMNNNMFEIKLDSRDDGFFIKHLFNDDVKNIQTPPNGRSQTQHNRIQALNNKRRNF